MTYLQEDPNISQDSLLTIHKVQPPYRLQVHDILSIQVKAPFDSEVVSMFEVANQSQLQNNQPIENGQLYFNGYTVDHHGEIRIPAAGRIRALGLTLEELREEIQKALFENYFKESASLFVTVKLAGLRYTVAGEVNNPGEITIFRDQLSIVEAIANSGGVPVTGDLTNVRLVRQYPDGVKVHHLDVTKLEVVYSPFYYIQPNDLIMVDPLPQKSYGTGTTGLSSFTTIISAITALATTILLFTRL